MNQAANFMDIALVGGGGGAALRCQEIAEEFGYCFRQWPALEPFVEGDVTARVVVAFPPGENKESVAEAAQAARFKCPESFLICVVSDRLGAETAAFAKKSGANLILLEEEISQTSKLEFAVTQVLKAELLPIKPTDLAAGKEIPFDVYHLMPLRGKFLKFAFAGSVLAQEKIAKLGEVGEIYIHKRSVDRFTEYVRANEDRSAKGLARRCRSQFLALYACYAEMAFLLTDQSERASFDQGAKLLQKCRELGSSLLMTLGEFGNAWDIVNNSTIGEFGSTERAPAVAAYAALFALQMEMEQIEEIMTAALLADLGLLMLPPSVSKKIRQGQLGALSQDELRSYRSYPQYSLDIVLARKLPMDEKLRELMLSTHERADGKGFPRGIEGRKLTEGAQLIQFCRDFDRRTLVMMGKARVDREETRRLIIDEESKNPGRYSPLFVDKLRRAFSLSPGTPGSS